MSTAEGARIAWLSSLDEALDRANLENKSVLLDFFSPV